MSLHYYDFQEDDQLRKKAYTFAYTISPQLTAILESMRAALPTLNTDGTRLNTQPERIFEADMRSSIYAALYRNRTLLTAMNDALIVQAACQAFLDNILFSGI